jgi:hypothetical protein
MQILHPFTGSIQRYSQELSGLEQYRPLRCPQCQTGRPLRAHGFYGTIRVRRFLCCSCHRTVSLLPEFALPYLRFSVSLICQFLCARLLDGRTLQAAAAAFAHAAMPYQRGQLWIRRFQSQAASLCAALAALAPAIQAASFVSRALQMLQAIGIIAAHRFLFAELRVHLLGWPYSLIPDGRRLTLRPDLPAP